MSNFARNGMIGKSGKFYPCGINQHGDTATKNHNDAPFATVRTHFGDTHVEFEAYYTEGKVLPTNAQFNTLMEWCTDREKNFNYITDCWNLPWQKWRNDE